MRRNRRPKPTPGPRHLVLWLPEGSHKLDTATPLAALERPLPTAYGLWVAEWDATLDVYQWRQATAWDATTANIISSHDPHESDLRIAYLERQLAGCDCAERTPTRGAGGDPD